MQAPSQSEQLTLIECFRLLGSSTQNHLLVEWVTFHAPASETRRRFHRVPFEIVCVDSVPGSGTPVPRVACADQADTSTARTTSRAPAARRGSVRPANRGPPSTALLQGQS